MIDNEDLDLGQVAEKTTGEYTVKHPATGAPTKACLLLAGPEHDARRAAVFARMRARQQEMERSGRITLPSPEEDEDDRTALAAACTLGWSGLARDGVPLVFTTDAPKQLYADPRYRWLRNQVIGALDQRELFFGGSAPA